MAREISSVYVINLPSAEERWERVQLQCQQAGLTCIRIEGVYGKGMSSEERQKECTTVCAKYCSPSSIGIALSHMKCWERILTEPHDYAMIIEDDCVFVDHFRAKLRKAFTQVPGNFDIVYVGCMGNCNPHGEASRDLFSIYTWVNGIKDKKCNGNGNAEEEETPICNDASSGMISENVFIPAIPTGFHCYIISKKGARFLLSRIKGKVEGHIDIQLLNHLEDLQLYALYPPLASQELSAEVSSNLAANYPRILNPHLHRIRDSSGMGLDYKLSINGYEIWGVPINGYLLVYLFSGILSGGLNIGTLAWVIITAFNLGEFILQPTPLTLKLMITTQLIFLIGILIGFYIRHGLG